MAEPDFLQRKKSGPCAHALNLFSFHSIVLNYQIYLFNFGSLSSVLVLTFRGPIVSSSLHGHCAVAPSIGPLRFSLHVSCLQLYSSLAQSLSEVAPSVILLASHSVCCIPIQVCCFEVYHPTLAVGAETPAVGTVVVKREREKKKKYVLGSFSDCIGLTIYPSPLYVAPD